MKKIIIFGSIGLLLIIACHLSINIFILKRQEVFLVLTLVIFVPAYYYFFKFVTNKIRAIKYKSDLPLIPKELMGCGDIIDTGQVISIKSYISNKMRLVQKIESEREGLSFECTGGVILIKDKSGYILPVDKEHMKHFVIFAAEAFCRFDKRFADKEWIIKISFNERNE